MYLMDRVLKFCYHNQTPKKDDDWVFPGYLKREKGGSQWALKT